MSDNNIQPTSQTVSTPLAPLGERGREIGAESREIGAVGDLLTRITRLEDTEAIRKLQAKYQRCLDIRDFDGLAECFTDDIDATYDNARESYKGKDNVLDFLYSVMTTDIPSSHLIHGGEIDILDCNKAHAYWYLEDFLLHRKFLVKLHGTAIYDVEYEKSDDTWRIKKIGYTRCYEYFELRGLLNILTLGKLTFLDRFKKNKGKANEGGIKAHIRHFTKKPLSPTPSPLKGEGE